MALGVSIVYKSIKADGEFEIIAQITGDTSYPSGGYTFSPSQFGLNTFAAAFGGSGAPPAVGAVQILSSNAVANSLYSVQNQTTGAWQLYTALGTEEVATTSVSTTKALVRVIGH